MICRITVRVGAGHTMPACLTPDDLARALRALADEIVRDEAGFDRTRWPRLVRTADGGWAGRASLSPDGGETSSGKAAP